MTTQKDIEKELSEIVANEWDVYPVTDSGHPLVQNVGGDDYAAYLKDYGVIGTISEDGSEWTVCHAEDGVAVDYESYSDISDAAAHAIDMDGE